MLDVGDPLARFHREKPKPTSSRLDCFCLLALTEELASLGWESSTGRGILELTGLLVNGMLPRP